MSYYQSFSNSYYSNHISDDSSTVFDADTVVPDEVPSLTPLEQAPLTATATPTDYRQNSNNSSPHLSQEESPATTISELLRRINSQHPAMPICEEISINHRQSVSSSSSPKKLNNTNSSGEQNPPQETATATTIIDNSAHHSMKRPRRSSRQKQLQPVQSLVDISDSEVENENELEDNEPIKINEEAVFSQSVSSSSQKTSTTRKKLNTYEMKWRSKFQDLCDYKRLHGHTNVPQKGNSQLGNWVSHQRREYKKFKKNNGKAQITCERIQMLESLGFEWVWRPIKGPKNESKWNKRFIELLEYKEKHGNANPNKSKDYKQLGAWVSTQRSEYKKFKKNEKAQITSERIQMLESIGFEWVGRPIPRCFLYDK